MMLLLLVFIITLLSGLISVTGGNGLILMPGLLIANIDIKEVMLLVRVSAVVFVAFNFFAMIRIKKVPSFDKKDSFITLIACLSVFGSVSFLTRLNNTWLMFFISAILIALFFLIVFKPQSKKFSWLFIVLLPIFSGICGGAIGGAGLILSILYLLLGSDHINAVQKRIIPSLIIQLVSFAAFMFQDISVDKNLLFAVIIATAISGYLNMKIFMRLSPKMGKILFYFSFAFSIFNLLEDAGENILAGYGLDWISLARVIFSA